MELLPNGAIVLTQTGMDERRAALFDFYLYVAYAIGGFVATVFFIFQDVPEAFRTSFVWLVTALVIVSFRAGFTYAVLHRWFRR